MSSEFALLKPYRFLWYQYKAFALTVKRLGVPLARSVTAFEVSPEFLLVPFANILYEPPPDPSQELFSEHIFFVVDRSHQALHFSSFTSKDRDCLLDLFAPIDEREIAYVAFVERKFLHGTPPKPQINLLAMTAPASGFAELVANARERL